MRPTTWLVLAIAIAAAVASGVRSEDAVPSDAAVRSKESVIRELLEVTGSSAMGVEIARTMMVSIRQAFPQVPAEVWKEFGESLHEEEILDRTVRVYERHLTRHELEAMLAFYKSPEGQSIVHKLPVVMDESMAISQRWGEDKMREIVQQLRARGYRPREG